MEPAGAVHGPVHVGTVPPPEPKNPAEHSEQLTAPARANLPAVHAAVAGVAFVEPAGHA
jgi:hypothetical protein